MAHSERERISHVARRLGFGVEPGIVETATSVDEAVTASLDLSRPAPEPPVLDPPTDRDDERSREQRETPYRFWFEQMVAGPRRIEERLVWFWHDHFATDIRKVRVPYLMYQQHLTLRRHATGSFAELLHAIAVDPAMLVYLDGVDNAADAINENFGREVMELFTLGRGHYTEEDVIAASRAFSGWSIRTPLLEARLGRRGVELPDDVPLWGSFFVPRRHDDGEKTLLGVTGRLDAADAIDIILDQDRTARFVGAKLYRELVGLEPDEAAVDRIAAAFRRDYAIMDLVEAIAAEPAFTSDDAIRAKVRTPLERAVGVAQAFGVEGLSGERRPGGPGATRGVLASLRSLGYLPFSPPNVGGYAKGLRLLSPFHLVHGFDLTVLLPPDPDDLSPEEAAARLGIFDLADTTREVLAAAPDPAVRLALTVNAPEYFLT